MIRACRDCGWRPPHRARGPPGGSCRVATSALNRSDVSMTLMERPRRRRHRRRALEVRASVLPAGRSRPTWRSTTRFRARLAADGRDQRAPYWLGKRPLARLVRRRRPVAHWYAGECSRLVDAVPDQSGGRAAGVHRAGRLSRGSIPWRRTLPLVRDRAAGDACAFDPDRLPVRRSHAASGARHRASADVRGGWRPHAEAPARLVAPRRRSIPGAAGAGRSGYHRALHVTPAATRCGGRDRRRLRDGRGTLRPAHRAPRLPAHADPDAAARRPKRAWCAPTCARRGARDRRTSWARATRSRMRWRRWAIAVTPAGRRRRRPNADLCALRRASWPACAPTTRGPRLRACERRLLAGLFRRAGGW